MNPFPKPISCKTKPDINYPCLWLYKVIGENKQELLQAIQSVCGKDGVDISPSHSSSAGKYSSFNVELEVKDEAFRLSIYEELKKHREVKVIL